MSDRWLRNCLPGAALCIALMAPAPATAENCAPLSAHFEICTANTPWADARMIAFDTGSALELGPYYVEFVEDWAGRLDTMTLDAALDSLLAEMLEAELDEGMAQPDLLQRDQFQAGPLTVARAVQSIDMGDGAPLLMATMIAQGEGARIAVVFGDDDAVTFDDLDRKAQAFVALIRPAQEG